MGIFTEADDTLPGLGDTIVDMVAQTEACGPPAIVLVLVRPEDGKVVMTSNLEEEDFVGLLTSMLAQHNAGSVSQETHNVRKH